MKIRNGFVSNSSSSSFILYFKTIPNSVSDIKELIFNKYDKERDFVTDDNCNCYPLTTVAKSILESIKDNIVSFDSMMDYFNDEYSQLNKYNVDDLDVFFDGSKYSNEFEDIKGNVLTTYNFYEKEQNNMYKILRDTKDESEKIQTRIKLNETYEKKYEEEEKYATVVLGYLEEILKENYSDYYFSEVEYSDNDGDFSSFMEHGGILDNISLIRISHH